MKLNRETCRNRCQIPGPGIKVHKNGVFFNAEAAKHLGLNSDEVPLISFEINSSGELLLKFDQRHGFLVRYYQTIKRYVLSNRHLIQSLNKIYGKNPGFLIGDFKDGYYKLIKI